MWADPKGVSGGGEERKAPVPAAGLHLREKNPGAPH